MRFKFDKKKSQLVKKNPKRLISFEETQKLFSKDYFLDRRNEVPEQFRAIGWVYGDLFSVIFEVREDDDGEYYHIVTLWKATKEERNCMKKTAKKDKKILTADEIADMADAGQDVSKLFTSEGKMVKPIQRVNVDFTADMLTELDTTAVSLNVSRQAVIKVLLRHALDQQYMAQQARKSG